MMGRMPHLVLDIYVLLATTMLTLTYGEPVAAQESASQPPAPPATVAAAKSPGEDPDRVLQAEYVGPVEAAHAKRRVVGLQVRPMGEGRFEAVQYLGGLPGQRRHQPQPVKLIGKRCEDALVLSGGPWIVVARAEDCQVMDHQGRHVGRLERVYRQSPTLGSTPPNGAIVLFDGHGSEQFIKAQVTDDGLLMQGADVKPMLQDFNLHLEYLLPYLPAARDQGRGNSGVYLQSRYELQILDSFAEEPVFNGGGSLYRFRKPDVNMCFPPGVWQTYDIVFTAPRWGADGKKLHNARITAWHNGVKIHRNVELTDKTGAGQPEEPTLLPIRLQDHGNPVRFRNIWVVDRGLGPVRRFPVLAKADGAPPGNPQESEAKPEPKQETAPTPQEAAAPPKEVAPAPEQPAPAPEQPAPAPQPAENVQPPPQP